MGKKMGLWPLVLLSLASGCFLFKPSLKVELSGGPDTNGGLPFHLLVRNVTAEQFRGESYAELARLAAQSDKSVLRSMVILTPSDKPYRASISIAPPKDGGVGLYFLFTSPTGSWRMLLEPPLPRVLPVTLGPSGIQSGGASAP